jgi:transcriptional regulator with XRE-family HTH domain
MKKRRVERESQYESDAYVAVLQRISTNARRLRAARGWTQEETAEHCDMAIQVFQRVETASSNLTVTTLARLCTGFQVDISELFAPPTAPAE